MPARRRFSSASGIGFMTHLRFFKPNNADCLDSFLDWKAGDACSWNESAIPTHALPIAQFKNAWQGKSVIRIVRGSHFIGRIHKDMTSVTWSARRQLLRRRSFGLASQTLL